MHLHPYITSISAVLYLSEWIWWLTGLTFYLWLLSLDAMKVLLNLHLSPNA